MNLSRPAIRFRRLQFEALEDRRMLAAGALDTTFGTGGKVTTAIGSSTDTALKVALQSDGKMVVVGYSGTTVNHFALARYNSDGSLDTTFDGDGKVTTPFSALLDEAHAVAIAADGKIVVAGKMDTGGGVYDFAVARYNTNGSLDTSFDGDGLVTTAFPAGADDHAEGVAVQADGKIVVVGSAYNGPTPSYDFAIARYNTNGSLDSSFSGDGLMTVPIGSNSTDSAWGVCIQPDGKIVVAGSSNTAVAVVRLTTGGNLDTTFNVTSKVTTAVGTTGSAYSVVMQSDGKVVVAGQGGGDFMAARYNSNGVLDPSFGVDGVVKTPIGSAQEYADDLVIQPDGKIVLAGWAYTGANTDFAVVRYNANGSLDTSFDGDGKVTTAFGSADDQGAGVALQSDGRLVVAGRSFNGSDYDFALARYDGGSLAGDYGQNGRVDAADFVLWRKTSGASGVPAYSGADGNGDGAINSTDYGVWRAHFGQQFGAGSGASVEAGGEGMESFEGVVGESVATTPFAEPQVVSPAAFSIASAPGARSAGINEHARVLNVAEPGTAGRLRDDALVALVESAVGVREVWAVEFDAMGSDSTDVDRGEHSCEVFDGAIGELMHAALL